MIDTKSQPATRYAFLQHTRRMSKITLVAGVVLLISVIFIILAVANLLPQGLGTVVALAGVLAVLSFILLLPLVVFLYGYARGGFWLDEQGVRIHFPGEAEQQMNWSEALYAVDEGEEFLITSKGKEGLGHLIGSERYLRLHLEGMTPEQRAEIQRFLSEHVEIRQPRQFTFATLLNTKGETVARGRLYVFENDILCMENRGKRRVFITAPLKKITRVYARDPFYVGKLECEAFVIVYDKKDFVIMLGYETTLNSGLGTSSRWQVTGSAQEWIEVLQPGEK
ncbi:MAG TPA: hypothetical protein VFN35_16085 [Ktedonobacteraceae bacterium]|nr:hypothetical protein [Ktedonobacteraceae bacterium]